MSVLDASEQAAIVIVTLVLLPICTLAVVLRFRASRQTTRRIGLEDLFALLALVLLIVYSACVLRVAFMLNGRDFTALTMPQLLYSAKLVYANAPLYWANQLCAKLSILLLYNRIFSVNSAYRWSIITVGTVHVCFSVAVILVALFGCNPIETGWNPLVPGTCVTTAPHPFLETNESINSAIDFIMVLLAVLMIRQLTMTTSTKLKLSLLFVLGGFAGVIGFIKIGLTHQASHGKSRAVNTTIALWTVVQQACSIICCCAPVYKSLLPSMKFYQILKSSALSSWSKVVGSSQGKTTAASYEGSGLGHPGSTNDKSMASRKRKWVILDGSSQKRLAEVSDEPLDERDGSSDHAYPLRTVPSGRNNHNDMA
jgi:hypothetical protein